jgi:hypothetical protein
MKRRRIILLLVITVLTLGWAQAVGAQAKPSGELVWALHVTISPSWFDPAENGGLITPYGTMARMDSPTFGVQATVAGIELPEEWQALLASQASMLAALLSRMQTAVETLRRQQAPAAQVQALVADAERVLTAQAQDQVNVAQDG